MKVAVVGAGIFGITSALKLDKAGHEVHLFEKKDNILMEASLGNQFRLHRGYHYPRSDDTVRDLLESVPDFEEFYGSAIIRSFDHFYCIAKENSLVSASEYLDFCERNSLEYDVEETDFTKNENIQLSIRAEEGIISYYELQRVCKEKLAVSGIKFYFMEEFTNSCLDDFDVCVNCTYSNLNDLSGKKRNYQFELCEKICVQLPNRMRNVSIVIMDGPFMCADPFMNNWHLLGNVVHAIHSRNVGTAPHIPGKYKPYMGQGFVDVKDISNFDKFIESGKEFIPDLEKAEYIGSKFVVRAVLPNVDDTDERPTIVSKNGKVIDVFSGKIDTCVSAANKVVRLLE